MKKIIFVLTVLMLPLCWQSCENVLEKTPDGQISLDEMLGNFERTYQMYHVVYNEIYANRDRNIFPYVTFDALTDNAFRNDGMFDAFVWHNGGLSLSSPIISDPWASGRSTEQLWPDFWRGVRTANVAIKYLPQSTAISEQERDRWVAEARVLRAWYYMFLLEFYGPIPWIDFPFEADYNGWNSLTRPSYDKIADTISKEMEEVVTSGVLPNRRLNTEFDRVSNGVARAIRARVLLNNASPLNNPENDPDKWRRAADAAQDVINMSEYEMVSMAEYKTLFVNQTPAKEVIWWGWDSNVHINNTNAVNVAPYPYATNIGTIWSCGENPTQELVDCFEMTNGALPVTYNDDTHLNVTVNPAAAAAGYSEAPGGDPYANRDARFYVDILYNGANYGEPYNCTGLGSYIIETFVGGRNGFSSNITQDANLSNTGYYNRKDTQIEFWGPGGGLESGSPIPTHWVHFRLAEFYLNKAEALCELNDLPGAMTALNEVRRRAGQPLIQDVPGFQSTQSFLRQRIRNERRVEFCMEGWRFHDQRRWKILNQTNRLITGMKITKESGGTFNYERVKVRDYYSYTDKYLVMPIPLNDAKKMTGMTQPEAWR